MCEIGESLTILLLSIILVLAGILILALSSFIERDLYKQVDLLQELGVELDAITTAGVFVVVSGLFGSLCAFSGSQHKEVLFIFIGICIGSLIMVDMTTIDEYLGKLYNETQTMYKARG